MKQPTLLLLLVTLFAFLWQGPPLAAQEYPGDTMGFDDPAAGYSSVGLPKVHREGSSESTTFTTGSGDPDEVGEGDALMEGVTDEGDFSRGTQNYTVRKGDTLGGISKRFFGSTKHWKKIANANGIDNPAGLKVGRVIKIPSQGKAQTFRSRRADAGGGASYETLPPVSTGVGLPPPTASLPLPPAASGGSDRVLYSDGGLPPVLLPGLDRNDGENRHMVTMSGLTGLMNTFAAYPLGKGQFSTSFGMAWNKVTRREGNRLKAGEDGDYWEFPLALTYSGENFEVAMALPFESYDIYAPLTYNFRDGTDSGMGDAALRLKFSSQNDNMASCLGIGALFPTSDRAIGNTESDNAWEVFAGISSKKKEGGNFHVNGGYQAGDGNTDHEGVFFNVGFEYAANPSFTFMGEINNYNRINNGRSTDLTLGMRYYVKPGMTVSLAAPIALNNDMFFGYDYRLMGGIQYHYGSGKEPSYSTPSIPAISYIPSGNARDSY